MTGPCAPSSASEPADAKRSRTDNGGSFRSGRTTGDGSMLSSSSSVASVTGPSGVQTTRLPTGPSSMITITYESRRAHEVSRGLLKRAREALIGGGTAGVPVYVADQEIPSPGEQVHSGE